MYDIFGPPNAWIIISWTISFLFPFSHLFIPKYLPNISSVPRALLAVEETTVRKRGGILLTWNLLFIERTDTKIGIWCNNNDVLRNEVEEGSERLSWLCKGRWEWRVESIYILSIFILTGRKNGNVTMKLLCNYWWFLVACRTKQEWVMASKLWRALNF